MSTEAVTWAMDDAPMLSTAKGKNDTTARHVLQTLAEHAHADGSSAHPSVARIQYRTGYDERTVQNALRRLEAAGLIVADGSVKGCTRYRLEMRLRRPSSDWETIQAAKDAKRAQAAERKRRSRARRVTDPEDVTVTPSNDVTEQGVTSFKDSRHVSEQRDVTSFNDGRHVVNAPRTTKEPPGEPSENQMGNGRQASTGSRAPRTGGSAATDKPNPIPPNRPGEAAAIGAVIALLPPAVRDQLPDPVPAELPTAISAELRRGLTTPQLVDRIDRRWTGWGLQLDADTAGGGRGLDSPVGVAVALVRRGGCGSPRCDDGTDLDTSAECRTCVREREDREAERAAARAAEERPMLRPLPGAGRTTSGQRALLLAVTDNPEPEPAPAPAVPETERAFAVCQGCSTRLIPRPARPPRTHCPACAEPLAAGDD